MAAVRLWPALFGWGVAPGRRWGWPRRRRSRAANWA